MLLGTINNINKSTERKRVLKAVNTDYLEYINSISWANTDEIVLYYSVDLSNETGGGVVSSFYNSGSTEWLRITTTSSNRISLRVVVNGSNVMDTTGAARPAYPNIIEIKNGGLYLDGVLYLSIPYTLTPNWSVDFTHRVGYSLFNNSPLNGTIFNFKGNNETFSLNEGNGADFKGSLGTIGTCLTGHSGGLNYINQEMIKAI